MYISSIGPYNAYTKRVSQMYRLHVIQYPSGRFGYVGSVPVDIAFVAKDGSLADPAEIEKACKFGDRFGNVEPRSFDTREAAVSFAKSYGYTVEKSDNSVKPTKGV